MPMAQMRPSYSRSGNAPGSIFVIRPFSTRAVIPQRGFAWQLGSHTVRIKRVLLTAEKYPACGAWVGCFDHARKASLASLNKNSAPAPAETNDLWLDYRDEDGASGRVDLKRKYRAPDFPEAFYEKACAADRSCRQ